MSGRQPYTPGCATGAEARKDGEKWTLVLVRDLPHPPATLSTVGAPTPTQSIRRR
jgi:hypothetical protein